MKLAALLYAADYTDAQARRHMQAFARGCADGIRAGRCGRMLLLLEPWAPSW